MGYMHIDNLYKDPTVILMFKEVFAMEKIHGTSAHISYKDGKINFFSGGEKIDNFLKLFNEKELMEQFNLLGHTNITVFGEAYGGKCQGMSETYGMELKFIAFEVNIQDYWLNVPNAKEVATKLGFEFVAYEKVPATIESLDFERDRPSRQAIRNGMGEGHKAEGIVIKPLIELIDSNGQRIIAKHKRSDFSERKSKKDTKIDEGQLQVLSKSQEIADEWVTPMRLSHVMDALKAELQRDLCVSDTSKIIELMIKDINREAKGEIIPSKTVNKTIGAATVKLFHSFIKNLNKCQEN